MEEFSSIFFFSFKINDKFIIFFISKLINETVPGIVDLNEIHLKKPLTPDQIKENLAFVLSSAKKIGCQINEETAHYFLEGKTTSFWPVTLEIVKVI